MPSATRSISNGLIMMAPESSRAAPANWLSSSAPRSSSRHDEFLRDQIHAVVEAVHVTRIRGAEETEDLRRLHVPLDQSNRLIVARPEAAVDRLDLRAHAFTKQPVFLQSRPARRRHLHEHWPSDGGVATREQPANRAQALFDALGVIHAIDGDQQRSVGLDPE